MDDDRYRPFAVLLADQRTELHQQQINFLEGAFREGFRPHTFGSENFGATSVDRVGYIIRRTRRFWELMVSSPVEGRLQAYVCGFDMNAEAVLRWLRGAELCSILEFVRPFLVPAGGRSSGFSLEPPEAMKVD